ncbi:hypothetical protein HanRHA438_Chr07g0318021 [Helianthus annuus]|nr:hypothetical protein HanRHA438_Chr07g0318021 [Helianthus annuus]
MEISINKCLTTCNTNIIKGYNRITRTEKPKKEMDHKQIKYDSRYMELIFTSRKGT